MAEKNRTTASNDGVVTAWITNSSEVADKAIATLFGTLQDVRAEANRRVTGTIDWVEGWQQGAIKLARNVTQRVDELLTETIRAAEQGSLTLTGAVRDTSQDAADAVSRSVTSLVSTRKETTTRKVAQA